MDMSGSHILDSMLVIQQTAFPRLLQSLLEERNGTKSDLFDYLETRGYIIEKTSLYRYFNANYRVNRLPDREFLRLFAQYVDIGAEQEAALLALWQMKRRRQ